MISRIERARIKGILTSHVLTLLLLIVIEWILFALDCAWRAEHVIDFIICRAGELVIGNGVPIDGIRIES